MGCDAGTLTISQQAFTESTAARFDVSSGRNTPVSTGLKLEEFDENKAVDDWPFCELVRCLMWLAKQTRLGTTKAVRAIATYANQPREVHQRTAIGILEYVFSTSDFSMVLQKGCELELLAFAGADYARSKSRWQEVSFRWCYNVCGSMPILVFENPEMRHVLDI